ncbi:hypothetical protein Terro_4241 [Terriglobus roseus DSM 18391]|uniref:Uncharacterized protein n=1 Tax=Terriglobus roseus (strain DSM 18391 / NRRL B-41598 / KBS 63) TaxID=926566 RepID=I3ZMH7_TERRK|nr:hypothetical protein [Terriglobus roseus]AFL90445.1 hypothetical protein Terro_4241 [Terriglobus roseus DSM 18391]
MDHVLIARVGLSAVGALQGVATVAIDCNRTHATNPVWVGHARFHVVWQTSTEVLLSLVGLALIWMGGPQQHVAFYLAALLIALSPLGFLVAFACRPLFRATLSDPNGIPPLRLKVAGAIRCLDMNLVAVLAALVCIAALTGIYRS